MSYFWLSVGSHISPDVRPGTVGPLRIGDDVITKDSLFVIIVEIDTRIYKTYPKLDYTIVHPKYPRDSLSSIYIMQ